MNQIYPVDSRRWLVLAAFCSFSYLSQLNRFTNGMAFVQYSPIVQIASEYYQVSDSAIIWLSGFYYVTYFLFAPLSLKPIQSNFQYTLGVFSFITAVGGWMKYLAKDNYYITLGSFILMGIGQLCILAAPAYISEKWFPQNERSTAISIGIFCNYFGMNFSILFVAIFFNLSSSVDESMQTTNLTYAILNTVAFILCLIFVRNQKTETPSDQATVIKQPIVKSFKQLIADKEIIIDIVSLSAFIGVSWSYGIIISIILAPFNYTQEQIGWVSFCFSITGTIGGTFTSIYVDSSINNKKKISYDWFIKIFITLGVLAMIINAIVINQLNDVSIIILSGFIGFGLNSFQPMAITSLIEKTFPVFELVLMTTVMQTANLVGLILNYILLLPEFQTSCLWVLLIFSAPFYAYVILRYHTNKSVVHQEITSVRSE